ncbi:dynein beta chain, ciliary-like [Thunnus albacares]|uniref:dynein beta chain, ciliary-like n=1 Tax=Thunnus maccoyii TaxID=8240 RepID=UPI001C4B0C71|nr:dynein beta chain, ciliary-like [Thunnus maccoyii]XP_044223443.1 dynein beta chain, ciliary-like [Thunnus albacares]
MAEALGSSSTSRGLGSGGSGGVRIPQEPSLKAGVVLSDERVDFLREQAFCVLRVKTDKWNRFIGAEENQNIILDFLDHIWTNRLLLFTGPGGTLHAGDAQTSPPWKTKLLCVLKRGVKRITRQGFRHQLRLGEVPGYPMEHLPIVISELGVQTIY